VATTMSIDRTAMVHLLDELEEQSLVERIRHPQDRRAFLIHLTDGGRACNAGRRPRSPGRPIPSLPRSTPPSGSTWSACWRRLPRTGSRPTRASRIPVSPGRADRHHFLLTYTDPDIP